MRLTQPPAAEGNPEPSAHSAAAQDGDPAWAAYPRVSVRAPLATTVGTSQLLPDGFARVGRAVQVLLGLSGIASLARIGFELWGLAAMRAAAPDDFAGLGLYGELSPYFGFGPAALMAVTGVLWLAWQPAWPQQCPGGRCAGRRGGTWARGSSRWPACGSPTRT
jgi:hypothetical protein